MNTELANALGQWWATHSNDPAALAKQLAETGVTLAEFCHATGQHEASLGDWLIANGQPAPGYNALDPKWDVYFRRAVAAPVADAPTDSRFSIGGKV